MTSDTATSSRTGFDRRLILPMVLGAILNPVNSSIIAVSLVPIGRAFGTPTSQTIWLVSGLYIATAIGQPVVGRLVDTYGPRRLFLIATVLTGIAGVIGATAPDFWVLVVARVVLGFGTCAGYPAAMTLIKAEAERTGIESPASVLTLLSISSQTIVVIGPTFGGLLIGVGGWRSTFAVNIPLALVAFAAGYRLLPKSAGTSNSRGFDVPGMLLFGTLLASAMTFLLELRADTLWLLAVAIVALVAFVLRETRIADPFLDLRVLAGNPPLVRSYLRALLSGTFSYAILYGLTQWLEDGRGLSASHAGMLLLPMSVTGLGIAAVFGRRPEIRGKLAVGAATQVAAGAVLMFLDGGTAIWVLIGLSLLVGIPQGLNTLALQNAIYYQAEPATLGASSGLFRTSFYLGAMVASVATGAFFGRTADTAGLHELAVFLVCVASVFLLITVFDRKLALPDSRSSTSNHQENP
ncbi:MAG: transporter [Marmoricola sp.]|nr:transporter [Marmoricola sp.]